MENVISGMKQVKVRCAELKKEIQQNRKNHVTEYEESLQGYQDKLVSKLEERLKECNRILELAENGLLDEDGVFDYEVPKPESHEKEYNRAIKMVEMAVEGEMVLDQKEFDKYVMDDWSWKEHFAGTTKLYNNAR